MRFLVLGPMFTPSAGKFDIYTSAADGTDVRRVTDVRGGGFPKQVDWGSAPIVAN